MNLKYLNKYINHNLLYTCHVLYKFIRIMRYKRYFHDILAVYVRKRKRLISALIFSFLYNETKESLFASHREISRLMRCILRHAYAMCNTMGIDCLHTEKIITL